MTFFVNYLQAVLFLYLRKRIGRVEKRNVTERVMESAKELKELAKCER